MATSQTVSNVGTLVYLAGPLFNEMELARNRDLKAILQSKGYSVYLPQDDAGISYSLFEGGHSKHTVRQRIFEQDTRAITECDIFVCLLDGRVPDEGTCVELGMAFALHKPCIGYKTDRRAMDEHGDNNIMVDGCIGWRIACNYQELVDMLSKVIKLK